MNVYIYKNEQQYGPYSIDQVRTWLSVGQLHPTDLACYEGASTWAPLHTLPELGNYHPSAQPVGSTSGRSEGWGLIIAGALLTFIGLLLCLTLIGAILGIPLFIVGLPMLIYGRIKYNRSVMERLKESVRVGVVQGMQAQPYSNTQQSWQQSQTQTNQSAPLPSTALFVCKTCGEILPTGSRTCSKCGTDVTY